MHHPEAWQESLSDQQRSDIEMSYSMEADSSIAQAKQAYADKAFERSAAAFTAAIDFLERDTSGATRDYEPHLLYSNRCACYLQLGNHELALRDAKKSVALRPDFAKGYSRLAQCYEALKSSDEALKAYERVMELDRTNTDVFKRMNALRQKDRTTSRTSSSNSSSTGNSSRSSTSSASNMAGSIGSSMRDLLSSFIQSALLLVNRLTGFYGGLNHEFRRNFGIGCAVLLLYIIYCRFFSYSSYDSYVGYGGYGGHSGGQSWTMWIAIVAAAYYVPPHLPQLGTLAQPFFGMTFSSFVYFLSLLTRGGGGYRGGFMGPGMRFGSPHGRRRHF